MARPKITVGIAIALAQAEAARAEENAARPQVAESQRNAEAQEQSIAMKATMMPEEKMAEEAARAQQPEILTAEYTAARVQQAPSAQAEGRAPETQDTVQFVHKALQEGRRALQVFRTDAEAMKQQAARARAARAAPSLSSGGAAHMREKRVASQDDSGVEPPEDDDSVYVSSDKEDAHGGGSSIGSLMRHETPLGRKMKERAAAAAEEQSLCTACGSSVHITNVQKHPLLGVGICDNCHSFIFSSPYTKDTAPDGTHGHENECRWCGDGGEVVLCDTCDKAFHKSCIKRNFGAAGLNFIEEPAIQWSCYYCDPSPLQPLQREYEKIEQLVKTMARTDAPARRKRPYKPRKRRNSSGVSPDESIAATIARLQEEMQRANPGKEFTGFDVKKPRRPRLSSFSYAARSRRPWGPKRMGNGVSFPSHQRLRGDPKPASSGGRLTRE